MLKKLSTTSLQVYNGIDLANIWGAQDSDHESGNRVEEAEGVLEEIRLAYRNFSAKVQVQESSREDDAETTATTKTVRVSGGSLEDQELSRLKRYLGPKGVDDFSRQSLRRPA